PALRALALPPDPMPAFLRGRPLKAWRYVAFFAPPLIACLAQVRIGPLRDSFWAVWDREGGLFWRGRRTVALDDAEACIASAHVRLQLTFAPAPGVETVCPSGGLYGWTVKQAPLPATATLQTGNAPLHYEGQVLLDDTAAYYPRHTSWYWSAGVGRSLAGQSLAWNLVSGVNDPPRDSERTVWVDGVASEAPPCHFAADLRAVDALRFAPEATLARHTNLGWLRSDYRQPMGTFTGTLAGGIELAHGLGVMERHDAWW
ncbi:MAG: hypothetical protein QOG59_3311, partial [Solirubrobacteraceae bacterium]|nr:hypothetical protein [Solirubrobacteraceae bacterium]